MRNIAIAIGMILAFGYVASACVPPVKPVPPVGCSSDDAVLVSMSDGSCKWYFMGCNE